jgi:hypothetical protein
LVSVASHPSQTNVKRNVVSASAGALPRNLRGGPAFINIRKRARMISDMDFQKAERFQNLLSSDGLGCVIRTPLEKVLLIWKHEFR